MPSTNATFPLRARSMMSPPAPGQSRTRLPFSSSTPPTTTLSSVGLSSCSLKKSSTLAPQHPDVPERPVQPHELLRREGLAPLQDLLPPRVGGTHLLLLLVREVQDVQDEHLVDLGPVEQVARALRRDLGAVVEDDRGREYRARVPPIPAERGPGLELGLVVESARGRESRAPSPLIPDEHGPRLQVLALLRGAREFPRRV